MSDLVEFLAARLDEDEARALAASPGPWMPNDEHDEVLAVDGITVAEGFALSGAQQRATVDHIVHQDPARVLREVEAKRRAIAEHRQIPSDREGIPDGWPRTGCGVCDTSSDGWTDAGGYCNTLKFLAMPHSGHPDYQEAWRV